MSGNWDFADFVDTDALASKLTYLKNKIKATFNDFPGGNIKQGTIPVNRLALPGAESWLGPVVYLSNWAAATQTNLSGRRLVGLLADGGAVTRKITGLCLMFSNVTKGAGNQLLIKTGTTYGAAVTVITVDLNSANLGAGAEPEPWNCDFTGNVDWPSTKNVYFDYVYGGAAGSYQNPALLLKTEAPHVNPA